MKYSFANAYHGSLLTGRLLGSWDQGYEMHAVQPEDTGKDCFEVRSRPQWSKETLANVALNLSAIAF